MPRRVLVAGTLILGLMTLLTACSPPSIGTVGVERNADGTLSVLIRVCRDSVTTLTLEHVNTFPHATDGVPASSAPVATATGTGPPPVRGVTVPLVPAVTFAADVSFPAQESALDTSVLFELRASGSEGNASSGLFGAVELRDLGPGQVLAATMGGDTKSESVHRNSTGGVFIIVTQDEFERRVLTLCG